MSIKNILKGVLAGALFYVFVSFSLTSLKSDSVSEVAVMTEQIDFFQSQLSNFLVPAVSLDGTVYQILPDGNVEYKYSKSDSTGSELTTEETLRILKTAYFSVVARTQPQFAMEGTFLDGYANSIDMLEEEIQSLSRFYPEIPQNDLVTNMFPFNFLRQIKELESQRRQLVYTPDVDDLDLYLEQLRKTSEAMHNDIKASIQLHKYVSASTAVSDDNKLYLLEGYLTKSVVQHSLEELEKHSLQLLTAVERQQNCFKGKIEVCRDLPSFEYVTLPDSSVATTSPFVPSLIQQNQGVYDQYYQKYSSEPSSVVALNDSACFDRYPTSYFVEYDRNFSDNKGVKGAKILLLNDLLFYDITDSETREKSVFLRDVYEKGYSYMSHEVTKTYMCSQSANDLAEIHTLLAIQEELKNHPVFDRKTPLKDLRLQDLAEIEHVIRASNAVSDSLVSTYMTLVLAVLRDDGGDKKLSSLIGNQAMYRLERLLLLHQTNTADVDYHIVDIAASNWFVESLVFNQSKVDPFSLLVTRAPMSLSFMLFNKATYPEEIVTSVKEMVNFENFNLTSYRDNTEFNSTYSPKEIVDLMTKSEVLHYRKK